MKNNKKYLLKEIVISLIELHSDLIENISNSLYDKIQDCQQAAIVIGETIEQEVPDEKQAVSLLEKYCEELYFLSQEEVVSKEAIDRLNFLLVEVNTRIEEIQTTYQVVFFPYKAEMWDSLESIWFACKEDKRCEAVVVPIPYYRYDADKNETMCFYDGDKFPDYVPIVSYLEYSLPNEMPEIAYIHNPYDRSNLVTSVHPTFYSDELKKYVEKLVYVPYYVTRGSISRQQSLLPAYVYMDYMVVQSEHFIKRNKDMFYYNKTLPLGSPKLDKVIRLCREEEASKRFEYPAGWKDILNGKKSLMLNTSLSCFLTHGEVYLRKLFYLFHWVREQKNVIIIWRPHPLLEATIHSLRKDLLAEYRSLIKYFETERIGILDTTPDISRTVAIADGYIGEEGSSVVCLFGAVGKPQFILNNYIFEDKKETWKRKIRIQDIVFAQGKYYFTSVSGTGLFSMKDNWEQTRYEGRAEGQPKWYGGYAFLTGSEKDIYLSPETAYEAVRYNVEDEEFKKSAPNSSYIKEKKYMSCRQMFLFDNKLFYLPRKNGAIWEYCIITKKWKEHKECIDSFHKNIEVEKYQDLPDTLDGVQSNNCIYIVAEYTNRVLCFDMKNGTHKVYEVGNDDYGYTAITGSDGIFWLAEQQSGKIIQWNVKSREIQEIEMPEGFESFPRYDGKFYVHSKLFEMDSWIVSVPAFSNSMVKIHKETGKSYLCGKEILQRAEKPTNDYHPKFHFACCFAKKKNQEILWVQRTCDDALIELNVESETYKIHYPTMTEESWNRLLQGEDGFERLDKDWFAFARRESRLFSLEDFINDFVSGKLEDVREKQLKELSDFAVNLDGSCGEKVHEFMMNVLENEKLS